MTLNEIKSMFAVGQIWTVIREGNRPLVINGNLGQTIMPAINGVEIRKVCAVKSKELVFSRTGQTRLIYTAFPKASEVVEARPGFLKFTYDNGTTITMQLGEAPTI
jgi:hypothetical protein